MECKLSKTRNKDEGAIRLDDQEKAKNKYFNILDHLLIKMERLNYRTRAWWMKWRNTSGVWCDPRIPIKLKGKFYKTSIRSTRLNCNKCWAVMKQEATYS